MTRVYDHPGALLRRLQDKARKYGELDAPLMLVTHADRFSVSHEDVDSALHGRTIGRWDATSRRMQRTGERTPGLWREDGNPARSHVSGVLMLEQELAPWTVARLHPVLWRSPAALLPLPELPFAAVARHGDDLRAQAPRFAPADLPGADGKPLGPDWPGDPWPPAGPRPDASP